MMHTSVQGSSWGAALKTGWAGGLLAALWMVGCVAADGPRGPAQGAAQPAQRLSASQRVVPPERVTSRSASARDAGQAADTSGAELDPYTEELAGTTVTFDMVPVPAGSVEMPAEGGTEEVTVEPFWIGKTEVTWDAYDVYVYELDEQQVSGAATDAISHPSKPYMLPGEDFGHQGYPALAMTYEAAGEYARWLSAKTGKHYRLPTAAEWKRVCEAAKTDVPLTERAWFEANADDQTHPVGALQANTLGVFDIQGNVAEWTAEWSPGSLGAPSVRGGAFSSAEENVGCDAAMTQTSAWNASDPQLPKSQWWLADAPFVGVRVVREPDGEATQP